VLEALPLEAKLPSESLRALKEAIEKHGPAEGLGDLVARTKAPILCPVCEELRLFKLDTRKTELFMCSTGQHKRSATMLAQFFPVEAKMMI
jgi:hypothetical protein